MRQRITVILTIVVILGLLVLVNAVTYVKEQKVNDSEFTANRSTYHSGPTGTRAFYDFLSESGQKVMRWREPTEKLSATSRDSSGISGNQVTTFVVIGRTQLPFTNDEATSLLSWVKRGGQLVLIDREFDPQLVPKATNWTITSHPLDSPSLDLDANDSKQMTSGVSALKPVQPTLLTQQIHAVMASRFSARIKVVPDKPNATHKGEHKLSGAEIVGEKEPTNSPAPVVEIANRDGALVVDFSYGLGKITLLGDPYVVANNGIRLSDNLQLARNLVTNVDGLIA